MRKFVLLMAFVGFAGVAHADGEVVQAPPVPVAQDSGPFIQANRIGFRFAGMRRVQGDCFIDVQFTVDGHLIQVKGRTSIENGRGDLFEPNRYSPIPDNQYSMGRFVMLGDFAVLLEVRDPVTGQGLLGIFEQTINHSGLEPASHRLMKTNGNVLYTYDRDIRTAGLNVDDLANRFERASSAEEFLERLSRRPSPRDVVARPSCTGPCGHPTGPIVPGPGPVGMNPVMDPSLVGPGGYNRW